MSLHPQGTIGGLAKGLVILVLAVGLAALGAWVGTITRTRPAAWAGGFVAAAALPLLPVALFTFGEADDSGLVLVLPVFIAGLAICVQSLRRRSADDASTASRIMLCRSRSYRATRRASVNANGTNSRPRTTTAASTTGTMRRTSAVSSACRRFAAK